MVLVESLLVMNHLPMNEDAEVIGFLRHLVTNFSCVCFHVTRVEQRLMIDVPKRARGRMENVGSAPRQPNILL
jgi:hypothetical protein